MGELSSTPRRRLNSSARQMKAVIDEVLAEHAEAKAAAPTIVDDAAQPARIGQEGEA